MRESGQYDLAQNGIQRSPICVVGISPVLLVACCRARVPIEARTAILTGTDDDEFEALPGPANSVASSKCPSASVLRDIRPIGPENAEFSILQAL